jgi:hypothetical protein
LAKADITAKAIDYSLSNWRALTHYLVDGDVPIDNNAAENAIRPLAIGRKNWLFVGSQQAGERAAVMLSLIESAKLNGHDPWAYLKDVFERLPTLKNRAWTRCYRTTGSLPRKPQRRLCQSRPMRCQPALNQAQPDNTVATAGARWVGGTLTVQRQDGKHMLVPWPEVDGWEEAMPACLGVPYPALGGYLIHNVQDAVAYLTLAGEPCRVFGSIRELAAASR